MNAIYRFVMSTLAKQAGKKTGITTIPRAGGFNVELSVKQIEQTLKNMGLDISKIKSTKDVQKYLNIHDSWMTQQVKKGPKVTDEELRKGIKKSFEDVEMIEVPKMSVEELTEGLIKDDSFKGWKPTVIEGGKGGADYGKLKEEWFSRLIANTDEDINTFLKRGIDKADDRFKNLSQGQRKDFLNMVQDRIQLGNEKFMDTYTDIKGVFNKFPEDLAGGGVAGGGRTSTGLNYLLGEDDQNVRMPVNQGGRIAFGLGGIDKARRAFLKWMGVGAATAGVAKSGLLSIFKGGGKKQVVESLTQVPIENAAGMPAWFKPLVNRVIKEGEDVTKKFATQEREIVHQVSLEGKLGKDALGVEDIRVTQDLNTGNVRVQYNTPNSMGEYGVDLNYQAAEVVEDASRQAGKQIKTKPEFTAVEAEPRVMNYDGDMEWDGENVVNIIEDLNTDTSKLKEFATGKKSNMKEIATKIKKDKYVNDLNSDTMNQADYIETKYGPGPEESDDLIEGIDFASGGRVPLAGGKKVGRPKGRREHVWTHGPQTSNLLDTSWDDLDPYDWLKILKALEAGDYGAAEGGRVPLAGGKGVMSLIQMLNKKFGKGTAKRASELKRPESALTREMFQNFNKELNAPKIWENPDKVRAAVDDIFSTGDYKMDAEMAAEALVENNPAAFGGKLIDDIDDATRSEIYGAVLRVVQSDLGKMLQMKRLSKPTKTLEGIKKTGTINISDPNVADEFTRFMKESDSKGFKDIEQKIQIESFDPKGRKKNATGGRVPMIFGGSAGLKGLWQNILKNISKSQGKKIDKFFPKMSTQEKELTKLGEKFDPTAFKAFSEREIALKVEGIEHIINRLKHDKKILKQQASNKAMKDEGLDFLMKHMEESEMFPPHLKKYTDIDKDILQMETIKKNLIMKDRKLNASGGLAGMLGE